MKKLESNKEAREVGASGNGQAGRWREATCKDTHSLAYMLSPSPAPGTGLACLSGWVHGGRVDTWMEERMG